MIVLCLVIYYLLAFALLSAVMLLTVRQNKRDADAAYALLYHDLQKFAYTPPMPTLLPPLEELPLADLSAVALQPIAPLLMRVAREYLDKPHDRERLLRSLTQALSTPATSSPAP